MGVSKYTVRDRTYWQVDEWLTLPDGRVQRFRKRKIPTKEQATMLAAKVKADAFEGRFFERIKTPTLTVAEAWDAYAPISERDNETWKTERGRGRHLVRHIGDRRCAHLTQKDVDEYRELRAADFTKRKKEPAPATLDLEIEMLKRILNYAVKCGTLAVNPVAHVRLLRKPNVRRQVLGDEEFDRLYEVADAHLKPLILVAFDTGMRKEEILGLRWAQVHLKEGVIRLSSEDTKTEEGRASYLRARVVEMLRELPRHLKSEHVFVNPETESRWIDIKKMWTHATTKAELEGIWFHDLRRSFVTNARRVHAVPESVVMKMSGHKTRAVFDRYNIVSEDDVKDAVRKMDESELGQELDEVDSARAGNEKAPSAKD